MRNLKVFIAYNGAAYHGFQRQDNALTVQEVVENSIGKLLKIPAPVIYGCSRTDTGVHARQFCFNVHVDSRIPCEGFVKGMNTLLPPDIAVLSCEDAPEDFHARYCTKSKEYVYLIANTVQRDVFLQNLAYHYPYKLDIDKMNEAAALLVGEHDFAAFCRAEGKARMKSTVREIYRRRVRAENKRQRVPLQHGEDMRGHAHLHQRGKADDRRHKARAAVRRQEPRGKDPPAGGTVPQPRQLLTAAAV